MNSSSDQTRKRGAQIHPRGTGTHPSRTEAHPSGTHAHPRSVVVEQPLETLGVPAPMRHTRKHPARGYAAQGYAVQRCSGHGYAVQRCSGQGRAARGSVTAEFAVLLPALVLLLAFVGAVATVGTAQVRAQHAAGIAAREEARGAHVDVARVAGAGATHRVQRSNEWVTVEVKNTVKLWKFLGPGIPVEATATARVEEVVSDALK